MIQVTMEHEGEKRTVQVPEDMPIGEVLKTNAFRGAEDGPGPAEGSPKVQLLGCACVIRSAFDPETLRDFGAYLPEALTLRDERGEAIFTVSLEEKTPGSLSPDGAVFSGRTDGEGYATMTILTDPVCDDPERLIRETLGAAILRLAGAEAQMAGRLDELQEKKRLLDTYIGCGSVSGGPVTIDTEELPF